MNVNEDNAPVAPTDASATEAELNARIDAELGLPTQEPETPETPETPEELETLEEEPEAPEEQPEETPEEPEEEPEPAVGTPSNEDLFIEIEDANGVTHKITTIEDLPEDFEPKNNRQALQILKDLDKLEGQIEQAAKDAETAEAKAIQEQTNKETLESWDREVKELAANKRIDIKDTDRINDVFGLMVEINEARIKAGNPNLINSFEDALDKFEAKEAREAEEAAKKNGNDVAKLKSSYIGGSSAAAGGDNYVYRAGSARSIDDIPLG